MPEVFKDDTPLNYKMMEAAAQFEVSPHEEKAQPSAEQIEANKVKSGMERLALPAVTSRQSRTAPA